VVLEHYLRGILSRFAARMIWFWMKRPAGLLKGFQMVSQTCGTFHPELDHPCVKRDKIPLR